MPTWYEEAAKLPVDVPDSVYNAARDNFFYSEVAPKLASQGYDPESSKEQFLKATPRPGRSATPRLDLVGKSAAQALTSPIAGMQLSGAGPAHEVEGQINQEAAQASQEATQQGIHPWPYQMLGQAAGMAPYFAGGMGSLEAGVGSLTSKALQKVARSTAVGLVQGAYDAASAPDGERGQAAFHGLLAGAAMGAAGETVHNFSTSFKHAPELKPATDYPTLWQALASRHDLTPEEGKAVQAVAQRTGSLAQEEVAARVVARTTGVDQTVQDWFAGKQRAEAKAGVPLDTVVEEEAKGAKVNLTGADGKKYDLKLDEGLSPELSQRVKEHLAAGGQINSVNGNIPSIQEILSQLQPEEPAASLSEMIRDSTAKMEKLAKPRSKPAKTIPESVHTLNAQFEQLQAGLRRVVMVPVSSQMPVKLDDLPEGIGLHTPRTYGGASRGRFLYNKEAITPEEINQALKEKRLPEILGHSGLGYGTVDKSQLVAPHIVVQVRTAAGLPLQDVVTDNANLSRSIEAGYAVMPPGGSVEMLSPEEAVGMRPAATRASLSRPPIDNLINSRNSVYHATSVDSLGEILESGEIRAGELEAIPEGGPQWNEYHRLKKLYDDEFGSLGLVRHDGPTLLRRNRLRDEIDLEYKIAKAKSKLIPHDDQGVSVSRVPRVASKSDKALTFVLDAEKVPPSRPFAESGFGKLGTEPDPKQFSEEYKTLSAEYYSRSYAEAKAFMGPEKYRRFLDLHEEAVQTSHKLRNPHFEFENRTYNKPISLKAVRGVLIDKEALERSGSIPTKDPELEAWLTSGELPRVAHLQPILDQLNKAGIPYKIFNNGRDLHSYRAGLANQPPEMRWAVNSEDIPTRDQLKLLPSGEVLNTLTGQVFEDEAAAEKWISDVKWVNTPTPSPEMKETPLSFRTKNALLPDGQAGLEIDSPREGGKPTLMYSPDVERGTIFHENLHGHFGALDLHTEVQNIMEDDTTRQIFNSGFSPASKNIYGDAPHIINEEVYVHGADAIRTGNQEKLQKLIDSDTDRETYLAWMTDKTNRILDEVTMVPDSLHKRVAERRLGSVATRASRQLFDLQYAYDQSPYEIGLEQNMYALTRGNVTTLHPTRAAALDALEGHEEPLNSPELVPTDLLPDGLPRLARASKARPYKSGRPPISTDPPPPEVSQPAFRQAVGGMQLFSRFVRPFYGWISTVSERNNWPELYTAFAPLDHAQTEYTNFTRPLIKGIQDTISKVDEGRRGDLFKWLQARPDERPFIEKELQFTPVELSMMSEFQTRVLDPMTATFPVSFEHFIQDILPKIYSAKGNVNEVFPKERATSDSFLLKKLRNGSMDYRDTDLVRVAANYMRFGAHDKFIEPHLVNAEKVIGEQMPDTLAGAAEAGRLKDLRAGTLYPLLQRHIDHTRGVPDYTQHIIQGAFEGVTDMIDSGIRKVNSKMPDGMQIPEVGKPGPDALGNYMLFNYAGMLALKPAAHLRDGLQLMFTTLPIAGRYTWVGMEKAFGAVKSKEEAARLWGTAEKYGALIERQDLSTLYNSSGPEGALTGSKSARAATFLLKSIQLTDNANRLAGFWGHTEQVLDAVAKYKGTNEVDRFIRDSAFWFMDKPMREKFLTELPHLQGQAATQDFAHRAAKELVELSNWNYKRGANPGIYEYQIGRLFGQYGTWPLNYIEYLRRMAKGSDKKAVASALATMALSHGATLATGQAFGVDTASWIGTAPASYSGSPFLEALLNIPGSFDPSPQGHEARRKLIPLIPGGARLQQAESIYTQLATGQATWLDFLGFHTMHGTEYDKGLHSLLPTPQE